MPKTNISSAASVSFSSFPLFSSRGSSDFLFSVFFSLLQSKERNDKDYLLFLQKHSSQFEELKAARFQCDFLCNALWEE